MAAPAGGMFGGFLDALPKVEGELLLSSGLLSGLSGMARDGPTQLEVGNLSYQVWILSPQVRINHDNINWTNSDQK